MAAGVPKWIADLAGTMMSKFQIGGTSGEWIKHVSTGVLAVRNAADGADADLEVNGLRIKDSGSANVILFQAPTLVGNVTFTLPADDGTPGQFLQTNGSGVLSWQDSSSNAAILWETDFSQADNGTLALFTPPNLALLDEFQVETLTAAGGGSPTLKIGIAGTTAKYMDTTENDLKTVGRYNISPEFDEDSSPDAVIATIVASSQTFTGKIRARYGVPV